VANTYLLWLDWPEKCFRADDGDVAALRALVPRGSRIVRVHGEREFLRALPRATHAIVWNFRPEWFASALRLRLLATPAAGREFVPERGPDGVKIHFGRFHGPIIAESVAAFALAWSRGFFAVERHGGDWPRTWLSSRCRVLAGTKAVIAGYGNIGRAIGDKLETLGVEVSGITRSAVLSGGRCLPPGGRVVKRLLAAADWLVMALPSTTGTDGWLDAARIALLSHRCVVINVGRGNSVDEKALAAALKGGRLAGAYLDVRRHEPSATVLETPGFVPGLSRLPNCVVMPHSSAFDGGYMRRCFLELKADGCL